MSAIDTRFQEMRAAGRKALIPFITAGDPSLTFTRAVVEELDRRGCSLCELGIPYSDPIADGPVIQASYTHALAAGVTLSNILATTGDLTRSVTTPLVMMVSLAIIQRRNPSRFVSEAVQAGVSGLIIPDLLLEEAAPMAELCRQADLSLIRLVTPTTPRERAIRIAEQSTGFLYYVSIAGITGERSELPPDLVDNVRWVRERTACPVCIGFGISQPEHVRHLAPVADGLIVGSAIMRRVAAARELATNETQVVAEIGQYVQTLLDALPVAKT